MKLLYIVPTINDEGGVARVMSVKTNYLIQKYGYEVTILTQNEGNHSLFYEFNKNILFYDIKLKGSLFEFFNDYKNGLKKNIANINPDIIIVCDNGLKAFLIPFILKKKTPIIFECHGSKYIEDTKIKKTFFSKIFLKLKYNYKNYSARQFNKFIVLSNESLNEWNVKNHYVIPNPNWIKTENKSPLNTKKVIVVARHSYEKGLDRLLQIWKKISLKNPEWSLEIYGSESDKIDLPQLTIDLKIAESIHFHQPVSDIQNKYLESSIYVMTSRSEGFPMVLIEAMSCGLPIVAYDCPIGPRAMIKNSKNGFLIEDGNELEFVNKLDTLMNDSELRKTMGESAKKSVQKYDLDIIMKQWYDLFESYKINNSLK